MIWSSCAFEHVGTPAAGAAFVLESAKRLVPGGTAVHTTEVRVDGGADLDLGGTILYSVATIKQLVDDLIADGFEVKADYDIPWDHEHDCFVDEPPFSFEPAHLKLRLGGAITSSYGLVVSRPTLPSSPSRFGRLSQAVRALPAKRRTTASHWSGGPMAPGAVRIDAISIPCAPRSAD